MDTITYLLLFTFLFNSFLSLFIALVNKKSAITKLFSLFGFSIALWCILILFYRIAYSPELSFQWAKYLYVVASYIPVFFLLFSIRFSKKKILRSFRSAIVIWMSILTYLILFTDGFISDVVIPELGEKIIKFGGLYYFIYNIHIPLFFVTSFVILYFYFRKSTKKDKPQVLIVLLSTLIASSIGSFTNLILPTLGIFDLNWLGQVSTFIWLAGTSYAILRYQFLDIRLFIGRLTYFSLNSLIAYVVFYLILVVNLVLFNQPISIEGMLLGVFFAILFVLVYDLTNRFIREKVTSRIINPGFDPNVENAKLNKKVGSLLAISQIAKTVYLTLSKTIRPTYKIIVLHNEKTSQVLYENKTNEKDIGEELLMQIFSEVRSQNLSYSNFFEVENIIESGSSKTSVNNLKKVYDFMKQIESRLIIAIRSQEGTIMGMIVLGAKDSDIPYTRSEQTFIYDIAGVISLSVDRSLLYQEVQEFNTTLQHKVDIATKELTQVNLMLDEALKKERDMMDIIGHELRTPLGTARNALLFMEGMREKGLLTDVIYNKYMESALRNIRREKDILETILQSARIENNKVQLDKVEVEIDPLIKQTLEAFEDQAKKKNLKLKLEIDPGLVVLSDIVAMQQIVDNLVSNAVKYTHHGFVKISIKRVEDKKIRFEFSDSGEGIKPEDLVNIGKKFFRANMHLDSGGRIAGSLVPRPGGTGIGIYVIKGLLQSLDSELKIESEFGKGSKFWFELKEK